MFISDNFILVHIEIFCVRWILVRRTRHFFIYFGVHFRQPHLDHMETDIAFV